MPTAIHFNPQIQPHLQHNDRTNSKAENIFKNKSKLNQCNKSAKQALQEIEQKYKTAMEILDKNKVKGKRTPKNRSFHEAIFEIQENTTMQECEEMAKEIEKLTGFQTIQIAIHKDEGHIDEETKEFKTHYHAHAVFFTLDKNTGKQLARQQASLNKANLSKMQTIASEVFKMERGKEYYANNEKSPNYNQDHKAFLREKAIKQNLDKQTKNLKKISTDIREIQEEQKKQNQILKDKESNLSTKEQELKKEEKKLNAFKTHLNECEATLNTKLDILYSEQEKAFKELKNHYYKQLNPIKNFFTFGYYNKKILQNYEQAKINLQTISQEAKDKARKELIKVQEQAKNLEAQNLNLQTKLKNLEIQKQNLENINEALQQENQKQNNKIKEYETFLIENLNSSDLNLYFTNLYLQKLQKELEQLQKTGKEQQRITQYETTKKHTISRSR